MGSFLDKPITSKHTDFGENSDFVWVVASMQGWRAEMEDAHVTRTVKVDGTRLHHFFGVFDGHGGKFSAQTAAESLYDSVDTHFKTENDDDAMYEAKKCGDAMVRAFVHFDERVLRRTIQIQSHRDCSGTTANVAYILPKYIVVANCGDSRSVLARIPNTNAIDDQSSALRATPSTVNTSELSSSQRRRFGALETVPMSFDHKPTNRGERSRIVDAGGHVSHGRVDGDLAVSRALGDFMYKNNPKMSPELQKVSPLPDITIRRRDEKDQFLIIACDGVWDVMSNEDAVDFVHGHVSKGWMDMERIASEMLDECLKRGSRDNMSVIILVFKHSSNPKSARSENENRASESERNDASSV